ncbi:hypothetical protein KM043_005072 [Ampulex compressa]|nr:hypothetical protein KM043_005072 [Ampulex compressa]
MASENVRSKTRIPMIPGTKPSIKNAQLLVSTGMPSLDRLIGGGLPIGSMFVIEAPYGVYSEIMLKYFMAEGIVTSQPLIVGSLDVKPSQLIQEMPAVAADSIPRGESQNANEQMMIAWRYQNLKIIDSSPMGCYRKCKYCAMKTLKSGQYGISETPEKRQLLRIAIHSLGSRLWLCDSEDQSHRDLIKFLYYLRTLLRNSYAVAAITIPVDNFDNTDCVIERVEHISDVSIRLESFAGSVKETNPLFKDYHGLLHIKKLPALNTLAPYSPESRDLAFKLRRKKFLIEVLHLPPEFADTAQREQDDIVSKGVGCFSGSHKNPLDF